MRTVKAMGINFSPCQLVNQITLRKLLCDAFYLTGNNFNYANLKVACWKNASSVATGGMERICREHLWLGSDRVIQSLDK